MNRSRLPLLAASVVVVPITLLLGGAGPAAAAAPGPTFGSHVSMCAQMSTGFDGQHNPSHHRGPDATPMTAGMHC